MSQPKQKTNKLIAPIVIVGVTVGFLASAYKFVFAKPKQKALNKEQSSTLPTYEEKQDKI